MVFIFQVVTLSTCRSLPTVKSLAYTFSAVNVSRALSAAWRPLAKTSTRFLSMKTRSIYQGFLVHITVAILMDWLALRHRHATPVDFWPKDNTLLPDAIASDRVAHVIEKTAGMTVVGIALVVVVFFLVRRFVRDRAARQPA